MSGNANVVVREAKRALTTDPRTTFAAHPEIFSHAWGPKPFNGKPLLTAEQAELLLDVKSKTAFRPGTLGRLPLICGRDVARMEAFLEIMGSSATRYVKV